jgi:hypothetical protein
MRSQQSGSIAAVCALLLSAEAHADLTYEVEAGVGHSDNISRVETGETDETLASIGANVDWTEKTRRLEGDVLVDLDYVEYLDDTYEGEVVGTADANFIFGIVPERLLWQVQDSFGQAQGDPFQPVTPDNSENVNYFTTGPDLVLNVGAQNSLRLFGRYSTTNYEETDLDGESTSAGLALSRELSGASRVGLNGSWDDNEFDNPLNTGYERRSAFMSYDFTGGRTQISTQLGYTWIELADGTENGGELVELSVTREVSSSSTLVLTAGSSFSDSSGALRGMTSGGGGPGSGGQVLATSDPYESRDISLSWDFRRNRTGISLGVAREKTDYEVQTDFNRTRISYDATFSRQLQSTLELMFTGRYMEDEYDVSAVGYDDTQLTAALTWNLSRQLGVRFSLEHYGRGSSLPGGDYDERRAYVTFTWSGGDQR